MTKDEKIEKLIELQYPLDQAVSECIGYFKDGFTALDASKFPSELQERALLEMENRLRALHGKRHRALITVLSKLDEDEVDALLFASRPETAPKLHEILVTNNEITHHWWNEAKTTAPTMNQVLNEAGIQFMINNTAGEAAESIAAQPLEDIGQSA